MPTDTKLPGRDGEKFVEFLEHRGSNRAGDRTWVDEDVAYNKDFFRVVPDEEREAIRKEAEMDQQHAEPMELCEVQRRIVPHNNLPGDLAWFTQSTAEDLRNNVHPPAVGKPLDTKVPEGHEDAEKEKQVEEANRQKELDAMPYRDDGYGLRGVAEKVADEIGEEPDGWGTDDLEPYLLAHWADYKAVLADRDDEE